MLSHWLLSDTRSWRNLLPQELACCQIGCDLRFLIEEILCHRICHVFTFVTMRDSSLRKFVATRFVMLSIGSNFYIDNHKTDCVIVLTVSQSYINLKTIPTVIITPNYKIVKNSKSVMRIKKNPVITYNTSYNIVHNLSSEVVWSLSHP